jgi:hypothetical protein
VAVQEGNGRKTDKNSDETDCDVGEWTEPSPGAGLTVFKQQAQFELCPSTANVLWWRKFSITSQPVD